MRILVLMILGTLVLTGCQPESSPVVQSPAPQDWESKWLEGQSHYKQENFEDAALAFRETLDLMDQHQAPEQKIRLAQQECIKALCRAGGNLNSLKLWRSMLEKNPSSKPEATRMIDRAKGILRLQGDELVVQGQSDRAEGHVSKAQASLEAAIYLYQETGESDAQEAAALKILEEFETPVSPTRTPDLGQGS